ncbi:hypothetical protein NQ314_011244 [Rhamnusium bicolor]|uniref:Uncharacterized protein n=1 Tax=Rhamnusium bicolor TaxID=1586634 RepID=A0AAV8XJR1_9CUCU|nr:hypothetical protein NQ314_011244 [Rhamnusium bicolor]
MFMNGRIPYQPQNWITGFITIFTLLLKYQDYIVIQACLCVLLGSSLDINKEEDHPHANRTNNIVMCVNIVIMAANVLISAFEMKESNASGDDPKTIP